MGSGSAFGAFLDPVADKVWLYDWVLNNWDAYCLVNMQEFINTHTHWLQLMVAAILVLLCSRPLEISMFGQVPWLITAPAIAIIGREVSSQTLYLKSIRTSIMT